MKKLASINKYFFKHKWRFLSGIFFVTISNYFANKGPKIVRDIIDFVQNEIPNYQKEQSALIKEQLLDTIFLKVFYFGLWLIAVALLRGIFMFFMRQTIIVMSRHIEYDQKAELYNHYQKMDAHFFKQNSTGDLMNRLSEDIGRVRMFTGPGIMYTVNLVSLTVMCIWSMLQVNPLLTLCVVIPLPILGFSIYYVNKVIYKKSSKIQAQLSDLTTTAQESFSGIRVIKSFVQEQNMLQFFRQHSEAYKESSINLAKTEAYYFPSMNLFIGLSMLSTILVGGYFVIKGTATTGNIAEFVIYINQMMFPMFIIGWVASVIQRAAASQQRIDEFLNQEPLIKDTNNPFKGPINGAIQFQDVSFTYQHTGITAIRSLNFTLIKGQKLMIMGETGSGKSTIAQLLLRMYDPQQGQIKIDQFSLQDIALETLRQNISYTPQDALLFSDTVYNNIKFGKEDATREEVLEAARLADLDKEIITFALGYETIIGERGVMLSGGQKQRMVLARAILKNSPILLLDECLSAVDTQTEKTILGNLKKHLDNKTMIVISHRIFSGWDFDQVIVLKDGSIVEQGTHNELMGLNGRYAQMYHHQTEIEN